LLLHGGRRGNGLPAPLLAADDPAGEETEQHAGNAHHERFFVHDDREETAPRKGVPYGLL
jgi:hypothetical protein